MESNSMQFVEPYSTVLVLNSSYEPLQFTDWKRAVILLFKEKAKLISKRVIRLVNYVQIPFLRFSRISPSRNMIYKRDGYSCQYCGSTRNLTIDHVIPRSRGGDGSWENLVCCCSKCNVSKGNKLLHETNMKLKMTPRAPLSKVTLELTRTKVTEWKEYTYT